jgi:hypothetical protein
VRHQKPYCLSGQRQRGGGFPAGQAQVCTVGRGVPHRLSASMPEHTGRMGRVGALAAQRVAGIYLDRRYRSRLILRPTISNYFSLVFRTSSLIWHLRDASAAAMEKQPTRRARGLTSSRLSSDEQSQARPFTPVSRLPRQTPYALNKQFDPHAQAVPPIPFNSLPLEQAPL